MISHMLKFKLSCKNIVKIANFWNYWEKNSKLDKTQKKADN